MRRTGNIRSPFGNHTRRIDVGVVSEPTVPASKRLTVPLSGLDMPATRTGCASVGWAYHLDSNAVNRRKQEYSFPEESSRVFKQLAHGVTGEGKGGHLWLHSCSSNRGECSRSWAILSSVNLDRLVFLRTYSSPISYGVSHPD
jgi:hypothetical protein